jgi:hypothetical protein
LTYAKTLQSSTEIQGYTEYLENKFNYTKNEFSLGYENDAIYLIQYGKDLNIEAIDLSKFLRAGE